MRRSLADRNRRSWRGGTLLVAMALVVLAVGFCLFDSDDGMAGHATLDLCLGMLATSVTIGLVSRLPLTGSTVADHLAPVLGLAPRIPAPPPKTPVPF